MYVAATSIKLYSLASTMSKSNYMHHPQFRMIIHKKIFISIILIY